MHQAYPWIVLLHLVCAIVFVGAVVYETLVLEPLQRQVDADAYARVESAAMRRVRGFMPFVVVLLFASGGWLFRLRCGGIACLDTRFGHLLALKVLLALAVLAIFARAWWALRRGRLDGCRRRHTHRVLLALMAGIVFLAKTMVYW